MAKRTCAQCGDDISHLHANRRYCSAQCKWQGAPRLPCSACGGPTGWRAGRTDLVSATCNDCRRTRFEHGTRKGYRDMGCRCEACKTWNSENMRDYIAKVKERDSVTPRVKYRKTPDVHCGECGDKLRFGGGGAPTGIAPRCVKCSRKRAYIPRSLRAAVYERDGYVCQLCQEPTDTAGGPQGPWWPTLDHIVPVSKGGTDDPDNLRTAHRWCNGVRGVSDPHGLFEEAS